MGASRSLWAGGWGSGDNAGQGESFAPCAGFVVSPVGSTPLESEGWYLLPVSAGMLLLHPGFAWICCGCRAAAGMGGGG